MQNKNHYAIIMAGGIGSRFWPMSRSSFPKQFQDILSHGSTLMQETFARFAAIVPKENIYIVTNQGYRDLVMEQLPEISPDQVLAEPIGRNTAPCVAYACYKIDKINPDAVFVVAPSDHLIHDEESFRELIQKGLSTCEKENYIMTLGIQPTRPDTGYGYIQYLEDEEARGYFKVKTFTEKPNKAVAESFLASGDFVWNAGIFLFSGKTIQHSFEQHLPDMAEQFKSISDDYYSNREQAAINATYATCKNISMDYGIMEKADNVFVIPSDFGWSDLGTWGSVHENSEKDYFGNAVHGKAMMYNATNNVLRTSDQNKLVVLDGLDGFIVVDTDDVLLICKKENEQSIRDIVGEVKAQQGEDYV